VTVSAFISTSFSACYHSWFRSPLMLQATVHGCCPYSLLLLCFVLFRRKSTRFTGVRTLQGSLSTLNSTQSFGNESSVRIVCCL
jgi:hypothetical protein